MFEATADISGRPAEEVVTRDAKYYEAGNGDTHLHRADRDGRAPACSRAARSCWRRWTRPRAPRLRNFALMITDIVEKGTKLLVSGDAARVESALGAPTATA